MMYIILGLNFFFCFCIGLGVGFALAHKITKSRLNFDEKTTYCHGFEDGIYYTLDEYCPDLFRIEIAENSYKEYKAIKHGPDKH